MHTAINTRQVIFRERVSTQLRTLYVLKLNFRFGNLDNAIPEEFHTDQSRTP